MNTRRFSTCANCAYHHLGECHFSAPGLDLTTHKAFFPKTTPDNFCGSWKGLPTRVQIPPPPNKARPEIIKRRQARIKIPYEGRMITKRFFIWQRSSDNKWFTCDEGKEIHLPEGKGWRFVPNGEVCKYPD